MERKHASYNALQRTVRGYLQDDRRADRGDERVVVLQLRRRTSDRVKKVADDAERIAAVQRRRGDASDRRGGGVVAGVKHGARRPVCYAVIGGALLVGDRGARTPKDHRSALGDEGLGPIPAVAGQAESQPFLCAADRDGEVFAAGRVSARVSASFWTALGTASPQIPITCDFIGTWT